MKKILIACLLLSPLLYACQLTETTSSVLHEEENIGTFNLEELTYTEEFKSAYSKYEGYTVSITIRISGHEDDSNYSNMYIDNVEFVSIEVVSGWDSAKFISLDSAFYTNNNQTVSCLVRYECEKDGEISSEQAGPVLRLPLDIRYNGTIFEKV